MEGWVGLIGWPIEDTLPTGHEVVTYQPPIRRRSKKVRQSKTDVLTAEPRRKKVSAAAAFTGDLQSSRLQYGEAAVSRRDDALVAVPADDGSRFAARRARQRRHAVHRKRLILRTVINDRRWSRIYVFQTQHFRNAASRICSLNGAVRHRQGRRSA